MWSWLEAPVLDGPFRAVPFSEKKKKGSAREGNATRVSPPNEGLNNKSDLFAHIKGTEWKEKKSKKRVGICGSDIALPRDGRGARQQTAVYAVSGEEGISSTAPA